MYPAPQNELVVIPQGRIELFLRDDFVQVRYITLSAVVNANHQNCPSHDVLRVLAKYRASVHKAASKFVQPAWYDKCNYVVYIDARI